MVIKMGTSYIGMVCACKGSSYAIGWVSGV